eukprot:jgi/Tetstr1/436728/TSEL_025511.t1
MGAEQSRIPGRNPVNEGCRALDQLGGWNRRPIKRGNSLSAKMDWLQTSVKETQDSMGTMVDNKGGRARIDMQEATVRQLKKVLMATRHDHVGEPTHPQVRRVEKRLKEEEKLLETMMKEASDNESAKLMRKKSAMMPELFDALKDVDASSGARAGNKASSNVKRVWVHGGRPEPKPLPVLPPAPTYARRSSMTAVEGNKAATASGVASVARSAASITGFARRATATIEQRRSIDSSSSSMNNGARRTSLSGAFQKAPPPPREITQYDAEFYGLPLSTPEWRLNIARAKYTFRLAFIGSRGFLYRLKLKNRPRAKLQRVPSLGVYVPLVLGKDLGSFAKEQMVLVSKADKTPGAESPRFADGAMSTISEGHSMKDSRMPNTARSSTGPNTGRGVTGSGTARSANGRRAGHSKAPSLSESVQSVVPTPSEVADMAAMSDLVPVTVSDFEVPAAAKKNLQMMHMYLNHYRLEALALLKEGKVAYQIHDSDVMMALRDGEQLPMWLQEPWDKVVEHLGETRLPLGDRFEGLTYAGRLMLSLHIALEAIAGAGSVKGMKMVLHIPHKFQDEIVQRFVTDQFYGFASENLVFLAAVQQRGLLL